MTKKQALKKTKELMKNSNKIFEEKIKEMLALDMVDLKQYKNDYLLPKILFTVFLKYLYRQHRPFSDYHRKEIEKLECIL